MPHPQYTPKDAERFWAKVDKSGECWLWMASIAPNGYGQFTVAYGTKRLLVGAHRTSYELTYGPIPAGLCIRHTCDTPRCVNPAHLLTGTQRDNLADMWERGRAKDIGVGQPGEANPSARLTSTQVAQMRQLYLDGTKTRQLATEFGVHITHVRRILRHLRW